MYFKHFLTISLVGFALPVASHAYFTQGDAGQEVFSFMNTFDSPRNAALEKSAGALPSTDPTITQLNPAAVLLPEGKNHVVSAHWQTGDMSENQGSLFFTTRYGKFILQATYNWLDYGTIDGYDEEGVATNVEYQPFSQLATATVSFPMTHFQFGATLKFASDKLTEEDGDRTALGAAFDWGLAWQSASRLIGISLVGRDFGCLLRDYVDDGDDQFYPMSQTFDISAYFKSRSFRRFTLFVDSNFPRFQEAFLNLGGEYTLGSHFAIRAGFSRTWLDLYRDALELMASKDRPDETNRAHMLSAGLGYTSSLFALDYGFSYLAEGLGLEHRMGLRVNF